MSILSAVLFALLGGAVLGVGGTLGVQLAAHDPAPMDAPSLVEEARKPEATDAEARLAVAQAPAVNLAVEAAVRPDASPRTVALAAYLGCLAAAQGKAEGSAAFGCQARGEALDSAIGGQ
jgi:hypothetical protein